MMKGLVSRQGRVVSKSSLTKEELQHIKASLTVRAHWDPNFGPPPPRFKVFLESDDEVCLPTYWAQQRFGAPQEAKFIVDDRPNMVFSGTLKPELRQDKAAEDTLNVLHKIGRGILAVHTGGGKTTIALYVACQLRLKTLVIVHKHVLLEQWQERIAQFVPGSRVGIIQGRVCVTEDKDVVVAMLQSLSQKDYCLTGFGLCIVDECNHVAAPTFSQAMLQANCPYVLGLSATPERKDGLTCVLEWFMGPIFSRIERKHQKHTRVAVIDYRSDEYSQPPPQTRMGKLNFSAIVTAVSEDAARNGLIVEQVKKLAPVRKTLILSDRRPHCTVIATLLGQAGVDAKTYLGGMSRSMLQEAAAARVICATYSIASEGVDIPDLNTLVLATPKRDIVQACGRILRGEGSGIDPLIIDIRDWWKCLQGQFYGRKSIYTKAGYSIS